jgi:hypothetical protein
MGRAILTSAITAAALLAGALPAQAATRYAEPASTDVLGSCSSLQPCRIDHAVNGAASGDEIVVRPGTYTVPATLSPNAAVTIRGLAGEPRPQLVNPKGPVLAMAHGGEVRHLYIEGGAALESALEIEGVTARRLVVYSSSGDAVEMNGSSAGTVLADSVARTTGAGTAIQTKNGKTDGPVKVLNVTVYAAGDSAVGVKVKHGGALGTYIRNSIVRGGDTDVEVYTRGLGTVDHSNLRAANSTGYTDGGDNQEGDPLFADAAAGDLRPLAGSPVIDAGAAADGYLGSADLDGYRRALGNGPDLGAHEFVPAGVEDPFVPIDGAADVDPGSGDGSGSGSGGDVLAPPAPPKPGKRVGVDPVEGTIRVRPPGSDEFVALPADASVPVGSVVDATDGVVELTTARDASGEPQTGTFWGGVFKVSQKAETGHYTELKLVGGSFASCKARAKVSAAGRRRVRQLWGRDSGGRFRTRGRGGHATVRGTRWLTRDRCDGTLFKVTEGAIDVKRKGRRGKVRLDAGERLLAKFRWRRRGRG